MLSILRPIPNHSKHKERLPNSEENWVVFKDAHDPIIVRSIWEQVQQKWGKIRKRENHRRAVF